MDIKDLNKSQLILLAILLSFITSIATGITTVTLLEQAPTSVTVPINRVIQQTVEKIVPVQGNTTTNTVIVKEEDLVVDAIAKNQSAVFSISRDGENGEVSLGKGFVVSADGVIVVDSTLVYNGATPYAKNSSGKYKTTFIAADKAGFSFLKLGDPVDPATKLAFTVPTAGNIAKMKAGQKILLYGGKFSTSTYDGDATPDLAVSKADAGGMVLNLDGEALGIALAAEGGSFASIDTINQALKAVTAAQ